MLPSVGSSVEMARGRFISKSLGASERFYNLHNSLDAKLAQLGLTEFAGELYMLLITATDDFGRFHGDAFTVKMQVFPVSPRRVDEFDAALQGLHDVALVRRYRYAGDRLALQIVDFDAHQQGLQKRTKSKFPPPAGDPPDGDDFGSSNGGANGASLGGSVGSEVLGTSQTFAEVQDFPADSATFSPEVEVEDQAEVEGQPHRQTGKKAERRRRKPTTDDRRQRAQQLVELWRSACPRLQPVVALTDKRITAACAALDRVPVVEQWRSYFERLNASGFASGANDRGWKADFDFALKADSWTKTFEGKYDDRKSTTPGRVIRTADDARAAVRERGVERVTTDTDIDLR